MPPVEEIDLDQAKVSSLENAHSAPNTLQTTPHFPSENTKLPTAEVGLDQVATCSAELSRRRENNHPPLCNHHPLQITLHFLLTTPNCRRPRSISIKQLPAQLSKRRESNYPPMQTTLHFQIANSRSRSQSSSYCSAELSRRRKSHHPPLPTTLHLPLTRPNC